MSIRTQGRTAALSWDSLTVVPADKEIRCRHDHIIVEPLSVVHSEILEVVESTRPLRGIVRAVGPGHYPKRYNHPDKHARTKMWRSPTFQPTEVKVGDVVELGGAGIGGYNFQTFLWGDVVHVICTERDVAGVCEDAIGYETNLPKSFTGEFSHASIPVPLCEAIEAHTAAIREQTLDIERIVAEELNRAT